MRLLQTKRVIGGGKEARYKITLEVTEYDIEMAEDIGTCYQIMGADRLPVKKAETWFKRNIWHNLWKLWKRYDK